jgi:hypothetical protein
MKPNERSQTKRLALEAVAEISNFECFHEERAIA